ncbi:KH domain-containing protein [Terriglobus sp. RCC_193]|uniref:KH domain-containing protein n=1 Tax=Terriglobus sp. ADX1 TaxID=2794063 RepID=UPI002FE6A87E
MTDHSSPESVNHISELLTGIAKALVDHPENLRVESEAFESETVLRLFVHPDDLGKVIGKQGRTARSLRTILSAAGSKVQHRFSLDVQSE